MLRMSEIRRRTSLSVSHLYALIAEGLFPPLVPFGARATGTLEDLVDAWLCARIDARDAMSSLHDPVVLPRWSAESVRVPALRAVRMLTLSEVEARVGMKKTSLYRAIASGAFPAPAPLTSNARRWPAHEIDAWVQTRIERSLRKAKQRVPAAFCASTVAPLAFARVRLPSRSRTQLISVPVRSPRALVHSNVAGSLLTDSDWALRVWRRCPCCVVSRSAFVSRVVGPPCVSGLPGRDLPRSRPVDRSVGSGSPRCYCGLSGCGVRGASLPLHPSRRSPCVGDPLRAPGRSPCRSVRPVRRSRSDAPAAPRASDPGALRPHFLAGCRPSARPAGARDHRGCGHGDADTSVRPAAARFVAHRARPCGSVPSYAGSHVFEALGTSLLRFLG